MVNIISILGYSYTKQSMSEQSEKYKQFIVKYIDILSNATTRYVCKLLKTSDHWLMIIKHPQYHRDA